MCRGLPSKGPIILNPHRALRAYHDKKEQEGAALRDASGLGTNIAVFVKKPFLSLF